MAAKSSFWKERQAEFEKYAERYASLDADWDATHNTWLLRWGSARDCFNVLKECEGVLNAIARKAITGSSDGHGIFAEEPWQEWVDLMRRRNWGFEVTGSPIACTELEWDLGVKDDRPLAEVRRKQGYTTGDEWRFVYERTNDGNLRQLTERELNGKDSGYLQKYYHGSVATFNLR